MIRNNGGVFGNTPKFKRVTTDSLVVGTSSPTFPTGSPALARTDAAQSLAGNQTLTNGNLILGTSGKGVTDSTGGTTLNFTSTGITSNSQFTAQRFNSLSGVTASTGTGVAATIFTTSGDTVWLVNAAVTGTGSPAGYVASAIVKSSGNAVVTTISSATNLSITASGANVQVTQTSGVAQIMAFTATRLF